MKLVRYALALVLMCALTPLAAHAQAALYGEFTATDLHNLVSTDILYGGTAGVLVGTLSVGKHLQIEPNVQVRFVNHTGGEKLDGINFGPRFSIPLKHGLAPFGEFLFGFARYNSGQVGGSTTDGDIQLNVGATRQLSPRLDLVADYSYSQYYALGGQYNPKSFSVGAIFHFTKR